MIFEPRRHKLQFERCSDLSQEACLQKLSAPSVRLCCNYVNTERLKSRLQHIYVLRHLVDAIRTLNLECARMALYNITISADYMTNLVWK